MKLLLEQNLSYKLVKKLDVLYPGTIHVSTLAMQTANDTDIWVFARDNNYIIVTQDADFYELALIKGFPPKVIWLRCGNTSTANISDLLISHSTVIESFIKNAEYACLELV